MHHTHTPTHMSSASFSKLFWLECRFGEYDLHDLVELDQMTAGVMIAADAETCQILTNRNAVSPLHNLRYVCMFIKKSSYEPNTQLFTGVIQDSSLPLSLRMIKVSGQVLLQPLLLTAAAYFAHTHLLEQETSTVQLYRNNVNALSSADNPCPRHQVSLNCPVSCVQISPQTSLAPANGCWPKATRSILLSLKTSPVPQNLTFPSKSYLHMCG